jgi:hypothetical protein
MLYFGSITFFIYKEVVKLALFGLPMEAIGGACAGISASFFTLIELENDSALAKLLFKTKIRGVVVSSVGSFLIGYLVNPLAGVTFEVFYYPACWLKVKRVEKTLRRLARELKNGESAEVEFEGKWHNVKKIGNVHIPTNNAEFKIEAI